MALSRYFGLVDLGIATVVIGTLILPAREMFAAASAKGDDAAQFALAQAEAKTIAHPDDGGAVADLGRRLGDAAYKDWAIEATVRGADRAKSSPSAWRALLAASVAYVDKIDVIPGLDYANRALTACHASADACPSWEEIRMRLYQQHLDSGVKSGIDPRVNPKGFRTAGEAGLRTIRINTGPSQAPQPAPTAPSPAPAPPSP